MNENIDGYMDGYTDYVDNIKQLIVSLVLFKSKMVLIEKRRL